MEACLARSALAHATVCNKRCVFTRAALSAFALAVLGQCGGHPAASSSSAGSEERQQSRGLAKQVQAGLDRLDAGRRSMVQSYSFEDA
eukprot:946111-Alexandrium_andersonii.AAC.1